MLSSISSFARFALDHFEGSHIDLKGLVDNTNGLVVVDFFADWCGPCKNIGRILPKIAEAYPKVTILKANVDESPDLAEHFKVEVVPQFKFFKKSGSNELKEIRTIVGADVDTLTKYIDELQ
ncbi:Thioredoxin family protein [Trichomonas vaginalis G3]|uniref:Thioredoxin family protein n=1 Tax=Trichomonas vaginalis (strain ATCC PRA-98 / G3) TaxID=412133 RepID=A2FXM7_TRIV3|nr:cell redox homeostasis [Trichomonas vaginalis G3]EAX90338.1 Thioredoxin family protein [Trichomonas vaginalis G3]KAI5505113.1 cell redox homeostasis [Trichomonas vaginalis G3]|eukprot:XP_001303268.1 Thioredoxin family protein [Trichomonas vaginalis G3]